MRLKTSQWLPWEERSRDQEEGFPRGMKKTVGGDIYVHCLEDGDGFMCIHISRLVHCTH